jgi:PAS domain S-box-containing protein
MAEETPNTAKKTADMAKEVSSIAKKAANVAKGASNVAKGASNVAEKASETSVAKGASDVAKGASDVAKGASSVAKGASSVAKDASEAYPGLIQAKAIVDTLQGPILLVGGDLKVLFANKAFCRKFQVTAEETKDKQIYSLGNGQWNIPELRRLLEDILPTKSSFDDYEVKHMFPNIGPRTMLVNARKLGGDNRPESILVVIEDVTERKVGEHKLLISEVRYRKLFETAKDGVLLIDAPTEKIIDANPFLLEMIGCSLEEVLGKELWEIGAIQDKKYAKAMFKELQEKGYVRYEDIPIKSKDGREHEVEFVSNRYPVDGMEMIQCNIRDITDRKTIEKKAAVYLEGLEKLNKMMTGREIKMAELKKEIEELRCKATSGSNPTT